MKLKHYLKKNGWLLAMAILGNALAFKWWSSYLTTGKIYDGKHGITFVGESATGHLFGATLLAAISTYYVCKSILRAYREE